MLKFQGNYLLASASLQAVMFGIALFALAPASADLFSIHNIFMAMKDSPLADANLKEMLLRGLS